MNLLTRSSCHRHVAAIPYGGRALYFLPTERYEPGLNYRARNGTPPAAVRDLVAQLRRHLHDHPKLREPKMVHLKGWTPLNGNGSAISASGSGLPMFRCAPGDRVSYQGNSLRN